MRGDSHGRPNVMSLREVGGHVNPEKEHVNSNPSMNRI